MKEGVLTFAVDDIKPSLQFNTVRKVVLCGMMHMQDYICERRVQHVKSSHSARL